MQKETIMDLSKFHLLDIIMICGAYGSGKTQFSRTYFGDTERRRISRTEIRKLLFEMTHFGKAWSPENFSEEDDALVKHVERKIIEHLLHIKKKVLIYNTSTTRKSLKRFLSMAKERNKTIGVIFLNTPLEKCIERNKKNVVEVPDMIIRRMFNNIEPPTKSDGFSEVLIINNY